MLSAQQYIDQYHLLPHPEGGWYKETYRSAESILKNNLPAGFSGDRNFSTAIYFLLEQGNFSAFHKIKSDECWHFYAGDPLIIYVLLPDGEIQITHLGNNIDRGELFQFVVPANCWFASRPAPLSNYCFVGCTVSPGFDFLDFEMASEKELATDYPKYASIIYELCKPS